MEGNSFTDELLEHINHIRMNPKSYAHKLRNYSQYFEDNVLRLPELKNGLLTNEGAVAFEEAATFMESLPKMEMISLDNNLSLAAQAMANEMSYYTDLNQMGNIDRKGIIEQFGRFEGEFGQSTDFGSQLPEFVIMNLIVDDGDKSRKNRTMMFNPNFNKIGLGTCRHSSFRQCTVIMYATNFIKGSGNSSNLKKPKAYNSYEEDNQYEDYIREVNKDYQDKNVKPSIEERTKMYSNNNDDEIDLPKGVSKIEKNERFIMEDGVKMKITKIVRYMDNGEINTEIFKTKV